MRISVRGIRTASRVCRLTPAPAVPKAPTVLSIRFALIQLYERLGQLLHAVAFDDECNASTVGPNLTFPRLWASLQEWGAKVRIFDQPFVRPGLKLRDFFDLEIVGLLLNVHSGN